jgi:2,4-dienoyl-CoA reductase-like NADH-dependent reductase (Old Yellow Enzyme family)
VPLLGSLQSRVVMSAMTRNRADGEHRATPAMREYYARRARDGVGLILTEGTIVHASGDGYNDVPHMATARQAESWRSVTDTVHDAGAKIFCQLWHCGRISHPDYTGGAPPVSSTGRAAQGIHRQNDKPFGAPRPLAPGEMPAIYDMFRVSAGLALGAGFDGVELHLAHGYLADQFFDARVNDRRDCYGGSPENRCRFGLELTAAVLQEVGADRLMVRISPAREMTGPHDWPDLEAMLAHLIPSFDRLGVRLLDVSCARSDYFATSGRVIRLIRAHWPHVLLGGASLDPDVAEAELAHGWIDLVTYGRLLIANPDFVHRLRAGLPLVPYDRSLLETLV